MKILRKASLVDNRGYWIGKDTTIIQTGDIVDRGPDTIAIYRLFDTLRAQARDAGGEVISLLGNHEVGHYPDCTIWLLMVSFSLAQLQFMNGTG